MIKKVDERSRMVPIIEINYFHINWKLYDIWDTKVFCFCNTILIIVSLKFKLYINNELYFNYSCIYQSTESCEFEPRSWRGVLDTTLCDLRQVGGFLRALRFPPPITLTVTIWLKYCWQWRQTPQAITKPS